MHEHTATDTPGSSSSPGSPSTPEFDSHGARLADLRPVDEHRRLVAALLPHREIVELPLLQALGRVLAHDVVSTVSLPPFDNSAMDGYAVRRADVATVGTAMPVSQEIPAGASDIRPLTPGTAARIMTGAPVPEGAEVVIPVEFTDAGTTTVTVHSTSGDHTHIRPAGDDVHAGDTVLTAETVLDAAHLAVAAATGHARLPVYRPVTVLVLSTGSELAEPGSELGPGQIYESNGQMLAAAVTQAGGIARRAHFVADDIEAFRATLTRDSAGVDLILTSGGVSAGAYEVVKDALVGAGVEFTKVAMQPGMPQGAGAIDVAGTQVPVVTLPGNPVSSFVSFEVFVRPAIRTAMGFANPQRRTVSLTLTEPVSSPPGKRQFRRGTVDLDAGTVAPAGGSGSHLLGALAAADCLFVVNEETDHLTAGARVETWLTTG